MSRRPRRVAAALSVVPVLLLALSVASLAATIPAWLDDAITGWNKAHPGTEIRFVAIKDAYAWYRMPPAGELTSKDIRERVYGIAEANGYVRTQDEEMVTTARPPVPGAAAREVKCWTRSFLRDPRKGSTSLANRMLTTMVCEEPDGWAAGFRILE